MVDITHYEVYTDRGTGWKLEERFSAEQRDSAIKFAREKEREKVSVKLIREKFDVLDNSYQESVEYVSLSGKKKSKGGTSSKKDDFSIGSVLPADSNNIYAAIEETDNSPKSIFMALLKLVLIVAFSLLFANIVVNLSGPLLEGIVPEESSKTLMFLFFFGLFLIIAVPLILKKVPWQVFGIRRSRKIKPLPERKFFKKAETIIRLYNLNDEFEAEVVPSFPEADIEFKRYIVDYLSAVISNLDTSTPLNDDFNRLGLKLLIYGGCMELSRYRGLNIAEANSLLYEAFNLLDGKNSDVGAFYEAKRSYKDNKVAVFLTGVGAYLMSQLLMKEPLDKNVLRLTLYKWNNLNTIASPKPAESLEAKAAKESPVYVGCLLNIKTRILFNNETSPGEGVSKDEVKASLNNIISNLAGKYNGSAPDEQERFASVQFNNVNQALRFALEFLKDTETYIDEMNNDNLIVAAKLNVTEGRIVDLPSKSAYIEDMFEQTYDNEILVDEAIYKSLDGTVYKFDFLGDKKLEKSGKSVPLYKLMDV